MSFNSSASGIPTVRRLNVESSLYERTNVSAGAARRVKEESKYKWQHRCSCRAEALTQQKVLSSQASRSTDIRFLLMLNMRISQRLRHTFTGVGWVVGNSCPFSWPFRQLRRRGM